MVHQVGVVNQPRRDVLIILNKLVTWLHGESLQHLQVTELICRTLMQTWHAILQALPDFWDVLHTLHVVFSAHLTMQRLSHLWWWHAILHVLPDAFDVLNALHDVFSAHLRM